jgi:hypothetical protein
MAGNGWMKCGALVAPLLAMTMGTQAVPVSSPSQAVLAPDARVEGTAIAVWTQRWWQWALAEPIAPYLDPDGRICDQGQGGPVWFLAGTDGSFNPHRECVVPTGKYLLLPVINMLYRETDARRPTPCATLQAGAAANNDHLISAVVLIDGVAVDDVARFRVRSDGCFVLQHDDNGAALHAAADGYWLMLAPLAPGRHTLTVGANYGAPDQAFGHMLQNFEYVLYVGGHPLLSDARAWSLRPSAPPPSTVIASLAR